MTDNPMSNDPGAPESTDPEATSPESVDRLVAEAEAAANAEATEDAGAEAHADAEADAAADAADAELGEVDADALLADADIVDEESGLAAELAERTEDLQRVTAEYTNYRRRVERDRAGVIESAKADVAAKLLPILDDLGLAAQHGDLEGPLKAVHDKLQGVMESIKVESYGEEGDAFDPDLHEAVQDTSSGDEKVLGTVLRKGYRLGDRVLRTAMVIIADA